MEDTGEDAVLTRSFLSYQMLNDVLETSNIQEDEEVRHYTLSSEILKKLTHDMTWTSDLI